MESDPGTETALAGNGPDGAGQSSVQGEAGLITGTPLALTFGGPPQSSVPVEACLITGTPQAFMVSRPRWSWRVKRPLETVLAAALLLLVAPLLAACVLAVRLSSRGPALFRQRRIGLDGRPFDMFKFRSMEVNDDSDTTWSVERDNRITRVGRVLRRTGLDELPQLLNVLRGEMALVGPRPERPFFVQQYEVEVPGYAHRHRVRPGITGWAQVHGLRGDTSIPERVYLDNEYIDTWAPWRDAAILLRTVVDMALRIF